MPTNSTKQGLANSTSAAPGQGRSLHKENREIQQPESSAAKNQISTAELKERLLQSYVDIIFAVPRPLHK